ncbi:MAG: SufE family protein [Cyclobacteriaceae bacterium]|nr:SufE family protein [Cyclobacteriaceae bacterium]
MVSINDIQNDIISDFALLDGDMEMTVLYVMELGQKMPVMPETLKTEDNIVKGCQSKVWLHASEKEGKIFFDADSNTAITKGLVSLLVRIFTGQKPEDILNSDLFFMQKIGMERFIGTQRSNGFLAMIKQIKLYALAFKAKQTI